MPLICAAEAEEKIPVSSNGRRNELALIRLYIYIEREGRSGDRERYRRRRRGVGGKIC